MTDLLMGSDVGTTFCKAAVVTLDGREVANGQRRTPWTPVPTGAEVDPRALAEASVGAALDALAAAPGGAIRGIGVCSMGETGVMLDGRGEPLAPGIAWHDARGGPEAERMADDLGAATFTRRTGLPVGPSWTAPKLDALVGSHPQVAEGRRWLSVAEWLVAWLGGDEVAELSLASRTGFLDVSARAWWPEALERVGIPRDVMPPLVHAGTLAGRVTRVRELKGAALTITGHDHPCASVGAGATDLGDALDSCGTAEAIVRSAPAPVDPDVMLDAAARGITVGCHVLPDRQVLLGFFKAGMALRRFLRLLSVEDVGDARDALDREALEALVGALEVGGLAEEVQRVAGIGAETTRGALWRAAQESAARETAVILREMDHLAGPATRLVVAGGWTRSDAYRTIKRGVLGPFEVPRVAEAGARGAALFGGLAAGLFGSVEDFPPPGVTTA
ncbi:MAG: FGGY-family carbohydrate kinase [Candidatus Rokuibacteriota bacterium]